MFRAIFMTMDEGAILQNTSGEVVAVNPAAESILGLAATQLIGRSAADCAQTLRFFDQFEVPFPQDRHPCVLALQTGQPQRNVLMGAHRPDGTQVWLSVNAQALMSDSESSPYAVVKTFRDVTQHRLTERYEQFRSRTLELLAEGTSLTDLLEGIVRGVEKLKPEMVCSILLLDSDGKHLGQGIAPSLPDFYKAEVDGLEIGAGVGCCGTAAATGERVIAEDIKTHPYWQHLQALVDRIGMRACWSEPIRTSSGQVLGSFAVYHRQVYSPSAFDISLIEKSARLVSIAIERKRMEQRVALQEQEYRSLAETSPDFIVRFDREGRHLYLNDKLQKRLGLASAQELIGKRPGEVWTDGRFADLEQAAARAVASASQVDIELVERDEAGSPRYSQLIIVPERDVSGHIIGTLSFGRDITAIRGAERKLKHFIDTLPGMAYTFKRSADGHASFPYASPAIEEIYGLKPEDVKHDMTPIHLLAHPEDRLRIEAAAAESARTMTPLRIETRVCRPGQPERWLDVRSAPDNQTDGSTLWHGIMLDITERKRAEALLVQREREFRTLAENLPDVLVRYDSQGRRTYVNPALLQNFSVTAEQLIGKTLEETGTAGAQTPEVYRHALAHTLATGERSEFEMQRLLADGSLGTGLCFIVAERAADGQICGAISIGHDITERNRTLAELERHRHHLEKLVEERTHALSIAKEAAEAATRAKSHFLAAASHDLRQPLQAIGLFNQALTMTKLDQEQQRISRNLSKSVTSLSELLNDLLDLSRLDADVIKPHPTTIQARGLLGMVGAEFDAACRQKSLRLKLFCPSQGLALFSDGNLLLTLVRNLVSNAVKYTPRGGVLVGIRQGGGRALIQVWDTGIGIAPAQLDSIFEEYFQVDNPQRDRTKGVGLGLTIVKRLSKLLGIELRVHSRVGQGSVFELSVPLVNKSNKPVAVLAGAAPLETVADTDLFGKRLVVVEDDAPAAEAIKLALEMVGAQVSLFSTAEGALGCAQAAAADYYISDYRLPGMNGLQMLDALQARSLHTIKAVLLTGNTSPDQPDLKQSSRWKVLYKPIDLPTLLSALGL